jgi:glycosyltransferase involved in cell wall biosynthesis
MPAISSQETTNNLIDITVLVTCYNEQETITDTLDTTIGALEEAGLSYEIVIIDDASTDKSVQLIHEYLEGHPLYPITLHINNKNCGLAFNYVDGAFLGRGKYYRLVCGDNAFSKEALVDIFKYTGKADIILTYLIQSDVVGKGIFRRLLSVIFTNLVNLLSGYNIKYYNGLATHLRHNILRWHPISYGFGFQADILTVLLEQGASYIQLNIKDAVDRKGGDSSAITMRNFLSVCHTLLEITIRRVRRILYGKNWPKPVEIRLDGEQ